MCVFFSHQILFHSTFYLISLKIRQLKCLRLINFWPFSEVILRLLCWHSIYPPIRFCHVWFSMWNIARHQFWSVCMCVWKFCENNTWLPRIIFRQFIYCHLLFFIYFILWSCRTHIYAHSHAHTFIYQLQPIFPFKWHFNSFPLFVTNSIFIHA